MYFYLWISHAQILIYIYGVKFWQFESICKIKPTLRSHLHVTFLRNLKKSKIFSITYDVNIYLRLLSRLYILPISCFFPGQMLVFSQRHPAVLTSVVSGPGDLSSVCLPDISPTHRTLSHVSSFPVNCMNILSSQNKICTKSCNFRWFCC